MSNEYADDVDDDGDYADNDERGNPGAGKHRQGAVYTSIYIYIYIYILACSCRYIDKEVEQDRS